MSSRNEAEQRARAAAGSLVFLVLAPGVTATHKALERVNEVSFISQMLPDGVMLAAVAIVTLTRGALPSWLGWLAAVAAPLLIVNGMFLDAYFGPAFLLFLLWMLLASVVLTLRAGAVRSSAEHVATAPLAGSA